MSDDDRGYGEQQSIRRITEERAARGARGSRADKVTQQYLENCRKGKQEYLYPPESFGPPPEGQGGGEQGGGGGFFANLFRGMF